MGEFIGPKTVFGKNEKYHLGHTIICLVCSMQCKKGIQQMSKGSDGQAQLNVD